MSTQLQAQTARGRLLVAIAEDLARRFAGRKLRRNPTSVSSPDRRESLKRTGFLSAPAPVACGGLGVESVHDVYVAVSRIARVDAALMRWAIDHLVILQILSRQHRIASERGESNRVRLIETSIRQLVHGETMNAPTSLAQATGLDGAAFGIELTMLGSTAQASIALGVAEAAERLVFDTVTSQGGYPPEEDGGLSPFQQLVESQIELAASRALFRQSLWRVAEFRFDRAIQLGVIREAITISEEIQLAKQYLNRATLRIVDRALSIVGDAAGSTIAHLQSLLNEARAEAIDNLPGRYAAGTSRGTAVHEPALATR